MPESARSLWKLAVACELLSRDAARRLVDEYGKTGLGMDAAAADVAGRLVADGHVSQYHAEYLLRGQRRRFRYGAYLVWDAIEYGRFAGLYRARRDGDASRYLLHRGDKAEAEAAQLREQRGRWRSLSADGDDVGLYRIVDELVVAERVIVVLDDLAGRTLAEAVADGLIGDGPSVGHAGCEIAAALARLQRAGVAYGALAENNVWCSDAGPGDAEQFRLLGPPLVQPADGGDEQARLEAWSRDAAALVDWLRRGLADGGEHRDVLERVIAGLTGTDGAWSIRSARAAADALAVFGDMQPAESDAAGTDDAFPAIDVGDTSMSARVKARSVAVAIRPRSDMPDGQEADVVEDGDQGRKRRAKWPLVAGVVSTLFAVVVVGWWTWGMLSLSDSAAVDAAGAVAQTVPDEGGNATDNATSGNAVAVPPSVARHSELWRSPTDGEPIDLAYLPSGVQMIVAVRAAELWQSTEGARIVETFQPWARGLVDDVAGRCGVPLSEVERLVVGFRDTGGTQPETIVIVRLAGPRDANEWLTDWGQQREDTIGKQTVYVRDDLRLWFPESGPEATEQTVAVIARDDTLAEIIDLGGTAVAMSRQLDALVAESDTDRQITILGIPSFLQAGGRDLFGGEAEALRQQVDLWLRDEVAAYLVSFDVGERFFSEIRVYPAPSVKPDVLARRLHEELVASPVELRDHVERLELSDYGRRLVMRLPRMVEAWTEFLRFGIEDRQVVFRSYLPAVAAHNLALGGQIVLLEKPSVAGGAAAVTAAPLSVAERLDRTISLSVPRDSLHATLEMLADELGVPVEVIGGDLETEGITRNQSISLEARDQTGREILATILRLADSEGRLVYVVHEASEGNDAERGKIVVTTRAAAASRGDVIAGPEASEIE